MSAQALTNGKTAPSKSSSPPNQTLYVTNLTDKLQKRDLRLSLYTLFSSHGTVLDVVAMPTNKMRGQAWIAFRDVQASTQAMRSLQGESFFGKQLKIQYAKGKSDAIAKLDGTYRLPSSISTAPAATSVQQEIFGGPPNGTKAVTDANAESSNTPPAENKGTKRAREDDSDEDVVEMEEDSDAPMEEASDEDD